MNKKALAEQVADANGLSVAAATRVLDTVFDAVGKALKREGEVSLFGFGTFTVKKRAARAGRNPQTGEAIKIKASKTVGFRPAAALKARI